MAEQITGGLGPDVVTLQDARCDPLANGGRRQNSRRRRSRAPHDPSQDSVDGGAEARARPQTQRGRHPSRQRRQGGRRDRDRLSRNKASQRGFDQFVQKAAELIQAGVHIFSSSICSPPPRATRSAPIASSGPRPSAQKAWSCPRQAVGADDLFLRRRETSLESAPSQSATPCRRWHFFSLPTNTSSCLSPPPTIPLWPPFPLAGAISSNRPLRERHG